MHLEDELLCAGLPTTPQSDMGTILVAGATGYIGGRLVPELIERGYKVRVMVRAPSPEHAERWPEAEVVVADALEADAVSRALEGIHTVFYLIHSMLHGLDQFKDVDTHAAANFRLAAEEQGVARIIYLGGLGDTRTTLSEHLTSRLQVADEFSRGYVPTTILRAAIIIGSGSASYEMINHLVRRLPVFIVPKWAKTKCQPIGLRDVIKSLVGVLELPETNGRTFDIGGSDILTYEEIIRAHAEVLGKKRLFIPSPISNIKFFSYITSFLTPVPATITWCLMESVTHDVVCQENDILERVPFRRISCKEALVLAVSREEQDAVRTRWSDNYPLDHELAIKLHELSAAPNYSSSYSLLSGKSPEALFRSFIKVGGREGWFHSNFLWRIRGALDRLLMGVGTSRGRRSATTLRVNDVIDFWRVEAIEKNRLLLLRAEMKLPGRAWLEFRVDPEGERQNRLTVTAYYQSKGRWGRIYWYIFLPFHHFIFYDLIKQIEKRSR
ncbi:MAG: SDR family oxidoreductase [Verrucomicrobiota bacterium]